MMNLKKRIESFYYIAHHLAYKEISNLKKRIESDPELFFNLLDFFESQKEN